MKSDRRSFFIVTVKKLKVVEEKRTRYLSSFMIVILAYMFCFEIIDTIISKLVTFNEFLILIFL